MENEVVKPSKTPWIVLGVIVLLLAIGIGFAIYKNKATPVYSEIVLESGQQIYGQLNGTMLDRPYTVQQAGATQELTPVGSDINLKYASYISITLPASSTIVNEIK